MKRQRPKNIRQIGNVSDSSKIYVEDYVDIYLNQLREKVDQTPIGAFLVGEIVQEEEEDYIYISGAMRMQEVELKGRDIQLSDNTWKRGCELCKEYFDNLEILGWFLVSDGQVLEVNHNLMKIHRKLFPKDKSIFVMMDAAEKEEKYFVYKFGDLMEIKGHYVFYEKNMEMQNYMISTRKDKGVSPSEDMDDKVTKTFRDVIQEKIKKQEKAGQFRFGYVVSVVSAMLIFTTGFAMIKEYQKQSEPQNVVEQSQEDMTKKEDLENEPSVSVGAQLLEKENVEQDVVEEMYIVKKGDTLASISKQTYGDATYVEAICRMNGLEDGNLIYIGQKLLLP